MRRGGNCATCDCTALPSCAACRDYFRRSGWRRRGTRRDISSAPTTRKGGAARGGTTNYRTRRSVSALSVMTGLVRDSADLTKLAMTSFRTSGCHYKMISTCTLITPTCTFITPTCAFITPTYTFICGCGRLVGRRMPLNGSVTLISLL